MKIAYMTREYPPDSQWGGVAIVYQQLSNELAKRGHEVHVVCQAIKEPHDFRNDAGVIIHQVGTDPKRYTVKGRLNYNFYAWRKVCELYKKQQIDIIDTVYWSAEGLLSSFFKKTPIVIEAQTSTRDVINAGTGWSRLGKIKQKTLSKLADIAARRADKVIANSRTTYEELIQDVHIQPENIVLVHHGIDTNKFSPVSSDVKQRFGIETNSPMVLSIGRLEQRKGIHILCRAIPIILSQIPSTKFVIVGQDSNSAPGGGSFKRYIEGESRKYKFENNLIMIDRVSDDELSQLYSVCDLFVLPSLYESFGLPVLEAMACGRSVVATATGIVPEISNFGLKGLKTVEPQDEGALANAILELLINMQSEDIAVISQENRSFVESNFSINSQADKMESIYMELMH